MSKIIVTKTTYWGMDGALGKSLEVSKIVENKNNGRKAYSVKGSEIIANGGDETFFDEDCMYQFMREFDQFKVEEKQ